MRKFSNNWVVNQLRYFKTEIRVVAHSVPNKACNTNTRKTRVAEKMLHKLKRKSLLSISNVAIGPTPKPLDLLKAHRSSA